MSVSIEKITYEDCKAWLLQKHYAKRIPSISYSFGLFIDNNLEGIITYGSPPSQSLCIGICGEEYRGMVLELNRLAINSTAPKNSASKLVGKTLKMLPRDSIIVSYADTSMGHVGKIYQATNFIYTGLSDKRTEWRMKDSNLHSKTICEKYTLEERKESDKFYVVDRPRKHRYIYFRNKKHKEKLKYNVVGYPKGESDRYECIDIKDTNIKLFQEVK